MDYGVKKVRDGMDLFFVSWNETFMTTYVSISGNALRGIRLFPDGNREGKGLSATA